MLRSGLNYFYITRIKYFLFWSIVIVVLGLSFRVSQVDIRTFVGGISHAVALIGEMLPPDFYHWKRILMLSAETVAVGFIGTIIGIVISVPLGFLSAKNTTGNIFFYSISKGITSLLRAIPEIMYAMLFVISIGMGPIAGVFALAFHTVGILSKFYAEAVESIDPKPVEAVRATGSHSLSVIRYAIVPQVFPLFMGYNFYLLDHNIRVATVLGLVGAGGLGMELFTQMRSFNYDRAAAVLIVIFCIITLIDKVSVRLRNGFIDGTIFDQKNRTINIFLLSAISSLAILSLYFIPVDFKELSHGMGRILEFLKGMFPPNFSNIKHYLNLILETVGMGISGTFLAVIIAIPLGLLSAKNITHNAILLNIAKETNNFLRAMPELMFALIFVAAVGLGPFAGVLAIALHTAGFLGTFYANSIENIDPKPVEAVEATGARWRQKIRYAVVPQVLPLFNSYNLYLLDRNIRASTVMGVVGAGGIGFELIMSMKLFDYQKTAALVVLIFCTVSLVDWISTYLRKKVV